MRKIHAKIKRFRVLAHYRRMERRSKNVKDVLAVRQVAPELQLRDRSYQEQILQRWAENMTKGIEEADDGRDGDDDDDDNEHIPEGEVVRSSN